MPPRERQKLQPRSPDVLGNLSERYYREGNVEGMRRMGQELQDRLQNHPSLQPGTGGILNTSPMEGGSIDPRSFWNVGLQSGDNTGIMSAAMTDYSPNAKGRWLTESPTGNKLFSYMVNKAQEAGFTSPESVDYLQNAIGGGGVPLWGGYVRPTWGDGSYGIEGNWKFGG
jgi:hypothetical protein